MRRTPRSWIVILCLVGCGGGGGGSSVSTPPPASTPSGPAPFEFTDLTQADLDRVQALWSDRDFSPRNVEVVLEDAEASAYTVLIYKHSIGQSEHYGVVTKPENQTAPLPIVISTDGLDQSNPTINGETVLGYFTSILDRSILVIPTFRGRTLLFKGRSFPADGDFCDAYDGAADDTIALLNVVEDSLPEADLERVLVRGGSRGGNTALLMAVRDPRVRIVDATAAPVDFYRSEVRSRYGSQYTCQFFTGKSSQESRDKMLASSPLHFALQASVDEVHLYYGAVDTIVPLWNGEQMHDHLLSQPAEVSFVSYPGVGHLDIYSVADYQSRQAATMEAFLAPTP